VRGANSVRDVNYSTPQQFNDRPLLCAVSAVKVSQGYRMHVTEIARNAIALPSSHRKPPLRPKRAARIQG